MWPTVYTTGSFNYNLCQRFVERVKWIIPVIIDVWRLFLSPCKQQLQFYGERFPPVLLANLNLCSTQVVELRIPRSTCLHITQAFLVTIFNHALFDKQSDVICFLSVFDDGNSSKATSGFGSFPHPYTMQRFTIVIFIFIYAYNYLNCF